MSFSVGDDRTAAGFGSPTGPGGGLAAGDVVAGRFRLMELLGEGGMGLVWKAADVDLKELVALKIVRPELMAHEGARDRFLKEIQVLRRLRHPGIVEVHELMKDAQRSLLGYTMQLLEGRSLRARIKECPEGLPVEEARRIFDELLTAIGYAHGEGVIHRDLKPENLFLTESGLKVLDFGLAKTVATTALTLTGAGLGTVTYVAPEQKRDAGKADVRSDIFSLGVILQEMFTGEAPEGMFEPAHEQRSELPASLHGVVSQSLQTKPKRRFKSLEEFSAAWAEVWSGVPTGGESTASPEPKIAEDVESPVPEPATSTPAAAVPPELAMYSSAAAASTMPESGRLKASSLTTSRALLALGALLLGLLLLVRCSDETAPTVEISKALADRERWKAASAGLQDAAVSWVARKLGSAYVHVRTKTYRCGGQSHRIATFKHKATGLELNLIPGGRFRMGSTGEADDEKPVHPVTVKPMLIGRTEVTQAAWDRVGGEDKRKWRGGGLPIERVSRTDATSWLRKAGDGLRLPSEAEWEFACRGGTTTKWCFGDDRYKLGGYGWFEGNSDSQTHPVGEKSPNAFGLHDMHGNVWEWCLDHWHGSYEGAPTDGSAWVQGGDAATRVGRGGSWDRSAGDTRTAYRYRGPTGRRFSDLGFRVARGLD